VAENPVMGENLFLSIAKSSGITVLGQRNFLKPKQLIGEARGSGMFGSPQRIVTTGGKATGIQVDIPEVYHQASLSAGKKLKKKNFSSNGVY
jgi:hypothetical protein